MKKLLISVAILSAFGASGIAHAQSVPTQGAKGLISFTGSINSDTCVLSSPAGQTAGNNLSVPMGSISASSLGTEASPGTSSTNITASATDLDLDIECATGTKVSMTLTPSLKSGKGIAVTGGAQNVQIMLVRGSTPLDFTSGSVDLAADGPVNGKYSIPLKAYYTLAASKTVADVTAGEANGTVNYVLKYE
jgi:major type 1 subunit fimbrin (pilin)